MYWCFDLRVSPAVEGLADLLLKLDYSKVVLSPQGNLQDYKRLLEQLEVAGIECYFLSFRPLSLPKHCYILAAEGGTKKQNMKIVANYTVDVLVNPSGRTKLKDFLHNISSGIDTKLLHCLKNRCLWFALPYTRIYQFHGYYQALAARQLVQDLRLLKKFSVPVILSCSTDNLFWLRHPEDITVLIEQASGEELEQEWLLKAFKEFPEQLLEYKGMLLPGLKVLELGECC
ncbi:MAG: hypothetical protein GXO42_01090 [bacterium]|nr:hypothetical protein [bacterium]